jgi:hypothetical protein
MNTNIVDRLSSVDIEEQIQHDVNEILAQENTINTPLKGILRKPEENLMNDANLKKNLTIVAIILFIILLLPLTFCDLYFGFTDISCSKEKPPGLNINLQLYLLLSGFMSTIIIIGCLLGICYLSYLKINNDNICLICFGSTFIILLSLFQIIWNILGAIIFWSYVYIKGNCNKQFSTYMFISLIIKLIGNLLSIQNLNKNKK